MPNIQPKKLDKNSKFCEDIFLLLEPGLDTDLVGTSKKFADV